MAESGSSSVENVVEWEMDPAFKRRAKIIGNVVEQMLDKTGRGKVVEIGCGRGFYEHLVATAYPKATIVGVDTNQEYLEKARQVVKSIRVKFIEAEGEKLPFKDNEFDGGICSEVLEHVEDDLIVLREIRRIIKPGGIGVFSVPVKNYPLAWDPINWSLEKTLGVHVPAHIWWLAGIWADHERLYSEEELVEKMRLSGWKVEKVWRCTKWSMPFAHFFIYGIGKNLVEKGFLRQVNRFNFEKTGTPLARLIRSITDIWDTRNDQEKIRKDDEFVNLVIQVRKK